MTQGNTSGDPAKILLTSLPNCHLLPLSHPPTEFMSWSFPNPEVGGEQGGARGRKKPELQDAWVHSRVPRDVSETAALAAATAADCGAGQHQADPVLGTPPPHVWEIPSLSPFRFGAPWDPGLLSLGFPDLQGGLSPLRVLR